MPKETTPGRRRETLVPAESLHMLAARSEVGGFERRLTYLMALRVLLITLVLGATTLLYWLGDVDLTLPNSLILYGIVASTYILTLVYALTLRRRTNLQSLAAWQLGCDLAIATLLVHVTGGAQSAYTFFYPLAIIASAVLRFRRGAALIAACSALLFLGVSLLGYWGVLPIPEGQRLLPMDMSQIAFGRAVALNLAAIVGVGAMSFQLAGQMERSTKDLLEHKDVAADLLTLHEDIVRGLTSGLLTVDMEMRILTINEAARSILDCKAREVRGLLLSEIAPTLATYLESSKPSQQARRDEVSHQTNGGTLTLGVSVSPLVNHHFETVGRIVNFQDLSEVQTLRAQVERADRLAVIGTLAAGVAHEIRNPLASISGSVELLSESPSADEDEKALMGIVTREIERLNALITGLLDYANPRPLNLAETDLREIVRDTLRVFAQNAKFRSVKTLYEDADSPVLVTVDAEKIRQLIWNLLQNGADAALARAKELTLRIDEEEEAVVLHFEDKGPGIPKDLVEHVFDPFFTTKPKGSGLGLATVHSIVLDHSGSVAVESEEGQGTRFSVRLPYDLGHEHS